MTNKSQITHDLSITYINNRYGAEVRGEFSVSTYDGDVTGSGEGETERLLDGNKIRMVKVGTCEKHFFGLRERTKLVECGYEGYEALYVV